MHQSKPFLAFCPHSAKRETLTALRAADSKRNEWLHLCFVYFEDGLLCQWHFLLFTNMFVGIVGSW